MVTEYIAHSENDRNEDLPSDDKQKALIEIKEWPEET